MPTNNSLARYWAVLPAAGTGKRFGASTPKQYFTITTTINAKTSAKTVLQHSVDTLCNHLPLAGCIIAINSDDNLAPTLAYNKPQLLQFVQGGDERMDSVLAGLEALANRAHANDWVLVHDVARPCIHPHSLQHLQRELANHSSGGVLAVPVRDTLKLANQQHQVIKTVSRDQLWQVQTPQMFRYGLLLAALRNAQQTSQLVTDEASAMELAGHPVQLVTGRLDNIKITYPDDLALATIILQAQTIERGDLPNECF